MLICHAPVETILKSSNPKILYLQILSQAKIIEKNPLNDYHIIEDARRSCQKYLIDYENLPDNDDKYRDVYKISEKLKIYSTSIQNFEEQKKQIVFSEKAKETTELITNKKADEDFMAFVYFQGYKSGLTLEEAKLEFPTFFKRTYKREMGTNAHIYINKADMNSNLFVKNGILAGNAGLLVESISDDANFNIGLKRISDIVNDLTTRFNLTPTKLIQKYDQDGLKFDATTFTWTKNGKSIIITYNQHYRLNEFLSTATYTQFDKCWFE